MNEVDRALAQVAHIQERMAAATRFRGFAPEAVALTGALALAAALAQSGWSNAWTDMPIVYILAWLGVALVSTLVIACEAIVRAPRQHGAMAQSRLSGTARHMLPSCAAGAVVTLVIGISAPDAAWMLPGLWQILIALLIGAILPSLAPLAVWAGIWYFVCGAAVLAISAVDRTLSPWIMGLPFAIGQFLVAWALKTAASDEERHG